MENNFFFGFYINLFMMKIIKNLNVLSGEEPPIYKSHVLKSGDGKVLCPVSFDICHFKL